MNIAFDTKLTPRDLFRFNMRQTYTSSQGPVSIILAGIVFVMAAISFRDSAFSYGILYTGVGILFLLYIPVTLWTRAKATIKKNEVLSGVLHYEISDKGIEVTSGEDKGLLEWAQIYKMIATGRQVLIFSNRVNAYIIPREQLGEKYDALAALSKEKLESYRVRM